MGDANVQKVIGGRVRKMREEHKMLQHEVASALHVSVSSYAKLESGDRGISSENCIALADLFGVSCDYILRGIGSENIDICKKTALDQKTIEALMENKKNEIVAIRASEEVESVEYATIREYSIANQLLNWFIRDKEMWEDLRRASFQYIDCIEEIFENDDIGEDEDSIKEYVNEMGLDAAKYIAGQAFGSFFARTMKDANFYRAVSSLDDDDIRELQRSGYINYEND